MKLKKMLKKICRIWSKRVSRYKVVEIQTDITTPHFVFEQEFHIYNNSINLYFDAFGVMGFHINLSRRCDHAGFHFSVIILGLRLMFELYDIRHWDDENDCPMKIDIIKIR